MGFRQVAGALALVVVCAGLALAGDEVQARRSLKFARDVAESVPNFRQEQALRYVDQARKHMEGLAPALVAELEEEAKRIEGIVATRQRAIDRDASLRKIERAVFGQVDDLLERLGHQSTGTVNIYEATKKRLEEYYEHTDARALTDEDRAKHQKQLEEVKAKCEAWEIESHFVRAVRKLERIEADKESFWGPETIAEFTETINDELKPANVPQNDPRVAEYKARLRKALDENQKIIEARTQKEKLGELTQDWTSKKNQFARDCPAWDAQQGSSYSNWLSSQQHGMEKALRRHEAGAEMQRDSSYQDAANFYKDEPSVVQVMTETQTWKREGADRLLAKADELLAECEKSPGAEGQKAALERLLADLEKVAPDATSPQATLTRARAALTAAGGTPPPSTLTGGGGDAPAGGGASEDDSGGFPIFKVLLGLMCCFGFLAVVGVGGFLAVKQMNAAKAAAPSP